LNEYLDPTKTILVIRRLGGVGDIFMTRPIFRAIKEKNSSVEIHYALPYHLIPLVADCEYIDAILPFEELDDTSIKAYRWHGDITRACIDHEIRFRGRVHIHRTDLWARHLGIEVLNHAERFRFTREEIQAAETAILNKVPLPENLFFVAPYSADPRRNLTEEQTRVGIEWARTKGMNPVIIHASQLPEYEDIPQIHGLPLRVWMAIATKAKMALTTDTGAMHLFGYLRVPTAAMHCFTSGKVVPKYYPTVVPFQLHRDNEMHSMPCVPCYDWGSCPYLKKDGNPVLKCVRSIPKDLIIQALEEAFSIDMDKNFAIVDGLEQKTIHPTLPFAQSIPVPVSSISKRSIAPTKPLIPSRLEIDMRDASEMDALIACGVASAIKSKHPDTAIAVVNVNSEVSKVLQLCPFATIDNSNLDNPDATRISIKIISEHKAGWLAAMEQIVGVPSDGSAGLSNCSTAVRREMFDFFGDRAFELRDIDGDPELNVPDKVWVQPEWNWEKKLACARLSRRVVTDKPAMAFACASLGIPVHLEGEIPPAIKGMRIM
jgi:ADP-heptose:LPS heptosyltransferase